MPASKFTDTEYATLYNNPLFARLSDHAIQQLMAKLQAPQHYIAEQLILAEGAISEDLFIILDGSVAVCKQDIHHQHQLQTLSAGHSFAEVALLLTDKHETSIHALEDSHIAVLPYAVLAQLPAATLALLKSNITQRQIQQLHLANTKIATGLSSQLDEQKKRTALSSFVTKVLLACCAYIYAMGIFDAMQLSNTTYLTLPMALLWLGLILQMMWSSAYPLKTYGITCLNWKQHSQQALILTTLIIAVLVLAKYLFISLAPAYQHLALLDLSASYGLSSSELLVLILTYTLIIAPFEELVRGGAQGSLQFLLTGKHTQLRANLLCNVVFSAVHVHMSVTIALLVFPIGMLWGWLFSSQNSVVGPIICHMLLGGVAFFIIGIPL